MYCKRADQLIIRDVRQRLASMDAPDWRQAMLLSWNAHPDWYRQYEQSGAGPIEQLLRDAGVDLPSAPPCVHFVGNISPNDEE
jgi:hypothetical protein